MSTKKAISQKIQDLEAMVEWFYSDEFALDDAQEKYKSAMNMAKEIETDLADLKNKIEVIDKDFSRN